MSGIYFDSQGHVHYTDPAAESFADEVDRMAGRYTTEDGELREGWEAADLAAADRHEHRFTILVGHAPITMAAGTSLPEYRECRCGARRYVGSHRHEPEE